MDKQIIDKLAYVYIKNKKVLVSLSKGKNIWYIPGGKRELGESDEQTLIREVNEELGVDLIPQTIKYFHTFEAQAHGKPEGTFVKMTCYTGKFSKALTAANEIEKIDFFDYSQKHLTAPVDNLIFDYLKEKKLIG
jgi:8-oxo-dGTP diphosphatase